MCRLKIIINHSYVIPLTVNSLAIPTINLSIIKIFLLRRLSTNWIECINIYTVLFIPLDDGMQLKKKKKRKEERKKKKEKKDNTHNDINRRKKWGVFMRQLKCSIRFESRAYIQRNGIMRNDAFIIHRVRARARARLSNNITNIIRYYTSTTDYTSHSSRTRNLSKARFNP